jgi:hypothetical protein
LAVPGPRPRAGSRGYSAYVVAAARFIALDGFEPNEWLLAGTAHNLRTLQFVVLPLRLGGRDSPVRWAAGAWRA